MTESVQILFEGVAERLNIHNIVGSFILWNCYPVAKFLGGAGSMNKCKFSVIAEFHLGNRSVPIDRFKAGTYM